MGSLLLDIHRIQGNSCFTSTYKWNGYHNMVVNGCSAIHIAIEENYWKRNTINSNAMATHQRALTIAFNVLCTYTMSIERFTTAHAHVQCILLEVFSTISAACTCTYPFAQYCAFKPSECTLHHHHIIRHRIHSKVCDAVSILTSWSMIRGNNKVIMERNISLRK